MSLLSIIFSSHLVHSTNEINEMTRMTLMSSIFSS